MKKFLCTLLALALCGALLAGALAEAPVLVSELQDADWISGSNLLKIRGKSGYYIADMNGTAITGENYGSSISYSNGLFTAYAVNSEEINSSGALNESGEEVIPFQYGDIKVLNAYWALGVVLSKATSDNYDYTSWFSDDVYLIETVDVYNLASGTAVASLPRAEFLDADAYGNYINIENRADNVVTTYDGDFNALGTVRSTYDTDLIPAQGLQTFRDNGQTGLMDADGNVVMQPSFYSIYDFTDEGYAEVYTGTYYGLIDETGTVIVPAEYEDINRTYASGGSKYNNHGYFCVEKDGKLGYVTAGGVVSCEPTYPESVLDNNGASATYTDLEGKQHILAGDGVDTVLDSYEYMYAADNTSGVFYRVRNADSKYGLLDFHGNVVIPCEYTGLDMSGDGKYVLVDIDYDNSAIYEITYPAPGAAAPEAEAVEEAEVEAEAAVEPAAASDNSGIIAMLDSVIVLLNQDAAGNSNTIVNLLNTAVNQLGSNSAAGAIIGSVRDLVQTDAVGNAATAAMLLENAKSAL